MASASQTFPCPECGKKLKWKPAIAGKVGKCACGAKVRAPETFDEPDDVSLLYDLAGPDKQPNEPPLAAIAPTAPDIAYATAGAQVSGGDTSVDSADLLFEVYLPLAVLMTGFVAILVWMAIFHPSRHEALSLAFMSAFAFITLVIKTVALSLLIWYIAKSNGGSLGNPITLVLKIAALLIFLDAAETWIREMFKATGSITSDGKSPLALLGCSLLMSFVIAVLISHFVYRLEGSAAKVFGRVVAVGNWAMNWIFIFLLSVLTTALTHAAARARAAATAAITQNILPAIQTPLAISPGTPLTAQPGQPGPTAMDELISQQIRQNPFRFQEGYAWCRSGQEAGKRHVRRGRGQNLYGRIHHIRSIARRPSQAKRVFESGARIPKQQRNPREFNSFELSIRRDQPVGRTVEDVTSLRFMRRYRQITSVIERDTSRGWTTIIQNSLISGPKSLRPPMRNASTPCAA